MKYDCAIIGGGIVGLSAAMALTRRHGGLKLIVIEKEDCIATHQTGRNSGVIHSGIYYKPGSFKAKFTTAGNRSMVAFCQENGIHHDVCGKVVVATQPSELPLLEGLYQRGLRNGIAVAKMSAGQVQEFEPHVRCLAGLKVASTGIVNYRDVAEKYSELCKLHDGVVQTGTLVTGLRKGGGVHIVETTRGEFEARFLINCSGLFSDRIARSTGLDPTAKIVPFRGEYYELVPEKRHLVNGLIYPVPNPEFPFLGVHFTRMINGSIHAGPNAVLALKREGYHKTDLNCSDLFETLTFPGFWKLAQKHFKEGLMEMYRSVSKKAFVKSLQRLIPAVTENDVIPTHSGVRAQALMPNGDLADDFLILNGQDAIHVCNAPSPAATASLEIGQAVAAAVPPIATRTTISFKVV